MSTAGQTLANPTQTSWLLSHAQARHVSTGTTRHDTLAPRRHVSTVSNKSGAASNSAGDTAFPPGHRLRLSLLATVRAASATMFATDPEPASLTPPSPPALATTSQGDSLGGPSSKLQGTLLATVAAAPIALAVRPCRGTARTVGRVLVHLAMLSTANGWMLPPKEEADVTLFSSHASTMGGVGEMRDRRRLWDASSCDGWCASPPPCLSFPPLRNPAAPLARSDGQTCETVRNSCNCDDFFGGGCDCDSPDTQRCSYTTSCDSSCNSCYYADCNAGKYGAAVRVTRGPRAIPGPLNAFSTPPHTVHH